MLEHRKTDYNAVILSQDSLFVEFLTQTHSAIFSNISIKHIQAVELIAIYQFHYLLVHQSSVLDFYNYIKKTGSISSVHSIYFFLWDYPDYLQAINSKNRLNVINLKKPALKILNEVKQIVKPISSKEDVMFENLNLLYKQLAHLNYTACFTETELDLIYKLKRFSDNKTLVQKCNISVATLKRRLKIIAEKCDNAKSKSEIINFLYENYVLIP